MSVAIAISAFEMFGAPYIGAIATKAYFLLLLLFFTITKREVHVSEETCTCNYIDCMMLMAWDPLHKVTNTYWKAAAVSFAN